MVADRRNTLGLSASAALPALWAALERLGWSHARFAREAKMTSGGASKLLYGDADAGRQVSTFCAGIGVNPALWDEPLPKGWRPHGETKSQARRRARAPAQARTGTDG